MNVDLARYGLGVVSLFPLAGRLEKLRGFFWPQYRAWFVVLSTIFSLVVYLRLQLSFETLGVFLQVGWAASLAALLLVVYLLLHLGLRNRYGKLKRWRLAAVLVSLLLLYCGAFALLTYSFNTLERQRSFTVYHGQVVFDGGKAAPGADLTFYFDSVEDGSVRSGLFGRFVKIAPKTEHLTSVVVTYRRDGVETHSATWVPTDPDLSRISLKPTVSR
jgi:hypothetical protein